VPVNVTEKAAARISRILASEGIPDGFLRLSVDGGGCQGFSYGFAISPSAEADDSVFGLDGGKIVVDSISLAFLDGATLDWVSDLTGESFRIENPNARSSCGCGTSFTL